MKHKILYGIMLMLGLVVASCSDEEYSPNTTDIITTVETGDATPVSTAAIVTGKVLDLSGQSSSAYSVGVLYSTSESSVTSGTQTLGTLGQDGSVTTTLTGLEIGKTYYYCTFVKLQNIVTKYGEVKSFTTTNQEIAAGDATTSEVAASLSGVTNLATGASDNVVAGFKISRDEASVKDGLLYEAEAIENSSFAVSVGGLLPGQTYYYVAYTNVNGDEKYSEVKSFTTQAQEVEFVDLGLTVEWASVNVGAVSPEDFGGLYGYGDVSLFNRSTSASDYVSEDIQNTQNDIAKLWQDGGMTPTATQMQELLNNTDQEYQELNGVWGCRFTSRVKNDDGSYNSIFLPLAGSRNGKETADQGSLGAYWTSNIDPVDDGHASALSLMRSSSKAQVFVANRYEGLSIRAIRLSKGKKVAFDASKVVTKAEGNNFRMELYNEYGSTKEAPAIDKANLSFSQTLAVTFRLSGVTDNLKEGAAGAYNAALSFADGDWTPQYWGGTPKYDATVTGDGEYTVWMEAPSQSNGVSVFCVDIANLYGDLADPEKAKGEIVAVRIDGDPKVYAKEVSVDASKVLFVNKDGNETDGRIEIYNEYGDTKSNPGVDAGSLVFDGRMSVTFTIEGIDDNLKDGASGTYKTEVSYADSSWDPSYWGGGIGYTTIAKKMDGKYDGTYTAYFDLGIGKKCEGAVVWTVELYNLWKDLVDTSKIKITDVKVFVRPSL